MAKFKYKSNWTKPVVYELSSDTKDMSKTNAFTFMREHEKALVKLIEENTDCTENYYILGNGKIIGTANMFDNATLIAEALASHSPYYKVIDVISREGLICHYLSDDFHNDRRNHIA